MPIHSLKGGKKSTIGPADGVPKEYIFPFLDSITIAIIAHVRVEKFVTVL
jgi:hypothetical protein